MTREEAIKIIEVVFQSKEAYKYYDSVTHQALDMAIEALKAQDWDEVVFDMNEFFSIVDDGKITVMRKGKGRVTVEHPAIQMETTICSYGGARNER